MVTVIKKTRKMTFAPVMGHLFLQKKLFINTSSLGTVSVPKCQAWFPAPDVSLHAPGVWEPPASFPGWASPWASFQEAPSRLLPLPSRGCPPPVADLSPRLFSSRSQALALKRLGQNLSSTHSATSDITL